MRVAAVCLTAQSDTFSEPSGGGESGEDESNGEEEKPADLPYFSSAFCFTAVWGCPKNRFLDIKYISNINNWLWGGGLKDLQRWDDMRLLRRRRQERTKSGKKRRRKTKCLFLCNEHEFGYLISNLASLICIYGKHIFYYFVILILQKYLISNDLKCMKWRCSAVTRAG